MGGRCDEFESPIAWNDALKVGHAPMDDVHQELVNLLGTLQRANDEELASLFLRLQKHLRSHFEFENDMMTGSQFPPRDCHIREHSAVLFSVDEVVDRVADGDFVIGRRLVASLVRWFPEHADYLDSALAHWLVSRRLGGKPIVLRRGQLHG